MKRLMLDYFRRWAWVLALGGILEFGLGWFIANRPELAENVARIEISGMRQRRLLAIVSPERLRRILRRLFAEEEFLSPHGLRALSKFHEANPYVLNLTGASFRVDYEPAESTSGLFGGNSNWRGPVWFPLNSITTWAMITRWSFQPVRAR